MTPFLSDLIVKPLDNGTDWELMEDYYLRLPIVGDKIINKGFVFDFASIPFIFRALFSPATGKYREPACVHDYLYRTGIVSREDSDNIFLELMKYCGVSYLKRYAIYWAVRVGGSSSYGRV